MRNPVAEPIFALLALLALSPAVVAQSPRPRTPSRRQAAGTFAIAAPRSSMFFLAPAQNREVPRDAAAGRPCSQARSERRLGRAAQGFPRGGAAKMTPVGQARIAKLNKPEAVVHLAGPKRPVREL